MEETDLSNAWNRVIDWAGSGLMNEGIVLDPLGKHPRSSMHLARVAFASDNYTYRKVAASLAGWTIEPDVHILDEFFAAESDRDAALPKDDFERLECQSIVEDVVFAASRWARKKELRVPALELLKSVVERTLAGQYWNTSSYAMVTMARHSPTYSTDLLRAFHGFAHLGQVNHPSNPSLTQERTFSEGLMRHDMATLDSIERVLVEKNKAAKVKLRREDRPLVDELVRAAERFDRHRLGAQPLAAPPSRRSPKGERGIFESGPGQLGAIL
jgi:hypothetical protein